MSDQDWFKSVLIENNYSRKRGRNIKKSTKTVKSASSRNSSNDTVAPKPEKKTSTLKEKKPGKYSSKPKTVSTSNEAKESAKTVKPISSLNRSNDTVAPKQDNKTSISNKDIKESKSGICRKPKTASTSNEAGDTPTASKSKSGLAPSNKAKGNFSSVSKDEKVALRDQFLEEIMKANKKPSVSCVTHSDIEDILIKNGMTKVLLHGKARPRSVKGPLLYKYFGKGTSLRPPTNAIYSAMKRAIASGDLKTNEYHIASAEAEAARRERQDAIIELLEPKEASVSKKSKDFESKAPLSSASKPKGLMKFGTPTILTPKPQPRYSPGLKCVIAATFGKEIVNYGKGKEDADINLEVKVDQYFFDLFDQGEAVAAMLQLKAATFDSTSLIEATQQRMQSYIAPSSA